MISANHSFLHFLLSKVMLSVGHILALTRIPMVSVHKIVTMMAAPHAFLEILQLIAAAVEKLEVGGSVSVAQLT